MSDESVDEIRAHYRAAARGEMGSLRWLDERIDVEHRRALGLSATPESEPVDQPRWQPERFIDLRDRVLVRVKLSGRARETGNETETRLAHLWTVRGGHATNLTIYHDWESGLSEAGLAE
jgi:ketosteroid isomerase-like protein